MKFVLAAGILAQTLPQLDALESQGLEASHAHQRLRRILPVTSILRQDASHSRLESIVLRKDWFTQRRKKIALKNRVSSFDECEPSGDDADIGILTCSLGEHCIESDASSLGGVCVADEPTSRRLQAILPTDVCDPNAELTYTCDCSLFDVEANTGQFSCNIDDYYCFLPGYCGSLKIDRSIVGGVDSSKYCVTFTIPSVAEICYTVDTVPSCSIEVNGVTCNSCEVVDILDDGIRGCYDWNCGNIFPNSSGNDCQGEFIISQLFPNALPNSTNIFVCDICGDGGSITSPNAALEIPNLDPPLTCGQVDAAAKNGTVLEPQCPLLQPFVQQSCGCVPPELVPASAAPSAVPGVPAATPAPTLVTSAPTRAAVATLPPTVLATLPPTVLATLPPTVLATLAPVATLAPTGLSPPPIEVTVTAAPTSVPVATLPSPVPEPVAPIPTNPPTLAPVATAPPPAPTLPPVSDMPPIYMSMSMSMSMSMGMGMRVRDLRDTRDTHDTRDTRYKRDTRDLRDLVELEEVLESEFGRFL